MTLIQLRRGTAAQWNSANPVLADGEVGIERGNPPKVKVGNGSLAWTTLPYLANLDGLAAALTVQQLQDLVDQAAAAADLAEDISNIATPDALVATLVGDAVTPSATRTVLTDTYVSIVEADALVADLVGDAVTPSATRTALSATYARVTQDAVVDVTGKGTHTTIEAALADIAAGGRILLKQDPSSPIASHWPSGPIQLPNIDGVTIEGWGRQVCGISFPAGNGFYFDGTASPTNWVFRNLYISGTGLDGSFHGTNGIGLDLSGATSGLVDNVRISSFLIGIYGTGAAFNSHHWRIENPRITNCGTGIKAVGGTWGTNNWTVSGGEVSSNAIGIDADGGAWYLDWTSFESSGLAIRYGGEAGNLNVGRLEENTQDIELTATSSMTNVFAPTLSASRFIDNGTRRNNIVNANTNLSYNTEDPPLIQTFDSLVGKDSIVPGAGVGHVIKVQVNRMTKVSQITYVPTVSAGNVQVGIADPQAGTDVYSNVSTSVAVGSANARQTLTLATAIYMQPGRDYRVAISFSDETAGAFGINSTSFAHEEANGTVMRSARKSGMWPLTGSTWSGLSPSPSTPWMRLH